MRRRAILDAAAAMLTEMPVAEVSLNELSRRVGLAKSNVLRYFDSREAVLLELLDSALKEWHGALVADPSVDVAAPVAVRGAQVAAVLAASLTARPVLCDLLSAQAAVLERNVSPQVAAQYKHAAMAGATALTGVVHAWLGELTEADAFQLVAATVLFAGAVWSHSQPSGAMLAAYETDPALAAMRLDFTPTLRSMIEIVIAGLLTPLRAR